MSTQHLLPYFPTRAEGAPIFLDAPYVQGLAAVVVVLFALFALLYAFTPSFRARRLLQLMSLRVGDNVRLDMAPRHAFGGLFGYLQTLLLLSVVVALLLPGAEGLVASAFWLSALHSCAVIVLLFLLSMVVYAWIGYVFFSDEQRRLWSRTYGALVGLWGVSLYLPVLLYLFAPDSRGWVLILVGGLYLLFRVVLLMRTLQIVRYRSVSPLLLILYLCSREVVPLLYGAMCLLQ